MIAFVRTVLCCGLLAFPGSPASAQNWLETTIEFGELVSAGDYVAAAELSETLVARAISEFGESSEQLADSHMIIAEVHMANEDYIAAEDSIVQAIQVFERVDGPLATSLIVPYSNLGDAYFESEEFALALRAYNEARGISRRAYGLNTAVQIPLIYREAAAVEASGDVTGASELQVEAVRLIQRSYGAASEESLAGLLGLAAWLSEHEYYIPAANQYRAASNLLRSGLGGEGIEIISTLRLAADNYRRAAREFDTSGGASSFTGDAGGSGVRSPSELLSALSIARDLGDGYLLLQAEIWRDLGDWYVAFGERGSIEQAYLNALALLEEIDDGARIGEDWFSSVVPVYRASLRADVLSSAEDAATGTVELLIEITEFGIVENIEIIASDPEGLLDREARRHVNNSRFRPLIENGRAVAAVRNYKLEYRYDPSAVEE